MVEEKDERMNTERKRDRFQIPRFSFLPFSYIVNVLKLCRFCFLLFYVTDILLFVTLHC